MKNSRPPAPLPQQVRLDLQEPVDPRGPDDSVPVSIQELNALFQDGGDGNEQVQAFLRQTRMQQDAARREPPKKPEEVPVTPWGVPDR